MKTCMRCKEEKPSEFFKKKRGSGLSHNCLECRDIMYSSERMSRLKNKANRAESQRRSYLLKAYGMTIDEYDAMSRSQLNNCAVCGGRNGPRKLCVDHCHETGIVRGLLCTKCNSAIGRLGDSLELLRKAVAYLERFEKGIDK